MPYPPSPSFAAVSYRVDYDVEEDDHDDFNASDSGGGDNSDTIISGCSLACGAIFITALTIIGGVGVLIGGGVCLYLALAES